MMRFAKNWFGQNGITDGVLQRGAEGKIKTCDRTRSSQFF